MEKNKKNGLLFIGLGALTIILIMGVIVFSPRLSNRNNENGKKEEDNLSVSFTSAELDTANSVGYEDAKPNITIEDASFNFSASFKQDGDTIIYNLVLSNNESIDVKVSDVVLTSSDGKKLPENIDYKLTYSDGNDVTKGDTIEKTKDIETPSTQNLKLVVNYKEGTNKDVTLNGKLVYVKK